MRDEIQMLTWIFQPSTTFMTSAIAYILMPDMSTVMKANEIPLRARVASPYRSCK